MGKEIIEVTPCWYNIEFLIAEPNHWALKGIMKTFEANTSCKKNG